jgi:hypothetical protein
MVLPASVGFNFRSTLLGTSQGLAPSHISMARTKAELRPHIHNRPHIIATMAALRSAREAASEDASAAASAAAVAATMAEGSSSSSSGDLGDRPMKRARGDGGSEARPQPLSTISGVDSPRTCGPGIASLWREGLVTDCIVVVEGREFAAHRVVLAAASPFMKAAFASGMQESISARVTLRDMRAAVFEAVITFMYENATSVPEADIAEVLQAARLLQEQELTNATLNLLIARLSPASCIQTWRMGDVLSLPSLANAAKLFALKHLSEVSAQDSFATLPAAWLHELLRSDDLVVAGEQVVYHALQQWYGLQQPSAVAMSDLDLLLRTVRWALLPQETANEAIGDPMVRATADGMAIVAVSFQDALFGRPPKLRKSAAQISQDASFRRPFGLFEIVEELEARSASAFEAWRASARARGL